MAKLCLKCRSYAEDLVKVCPKCGQYMQEIDDDTNSALEEQIIKNERKNSRNSNIKFLIVFIFIIMTIWYGCSSINNKKAKSFETPIKTLIKAQNDRNIKLMFTAYPQFLHSSLDKELNGKMDQIISDDITNITYTISSKIKLDKNNLDGYTEEYKNKYISGIKITSGYKVILDINRKQFGISENINTTHTILEIDDSWYIID